MRILLFHDASPLGTALAEALAAPNVVAITEPVDEIAELEGDVALIVNVLSRLPLDELRALPFGAFSVHSSAEGVAIHRLGGEIVMRGTTPIDVVEEFLERLERCEILPM